MIKQIAVFFPGIGYTNNHPLLYHSIKLATKYDYKIKKLEFSGFPTKLKGNREAMFSAIQIAREQAEDQLKFIDFSLYDDIVFISKSIGTTAAAIYAAKHKIPARQLFFTPLEQTFSFAEKDNGIIFHGTADAWVNTNIVKAACTQKNLPLVLIPEANHSLEVEDVFTNIEELGRIMKEVDHFLSSSLSSLPSSPSSPSSPSPSSPSSPS